MKITKKDIFSIPNCLSFFRLLLLPVICVLYIRADSIRDYYIAAAVVVISSLTDLLDGKIARKFNMITELGILLDPLADKLTHIVIAWCLVLRYPNMKYLVLVLMLKEAYMLIMGIVHYRHGTKLKGAKLFGKACTTTLFIALALFIFFPGLPIGFANIIIYIEIVVMLITWGLYIPVFHKMKEEWEEK